MKLNELLGVKHLHGIHQNELNDVLGKMTEIKFMGKGHYASVFELKGQIYKFWIKDGGYEKFIEFVKDTESPALPRLLSPVKTLTAFFTRTQITPDKVKYVKIEKLEKVHHQDRLKVNSHDTVSIDDLLRVMNLSFGADTLDSFLEEMQSRLKMNHRFSQDYVDFVTLGWKMFKKFGRNDLDIHWFNVMKRGDQLVYTDPISTTDDWTFNAQLHTLNGEHVDMVKGPKKREA